METDASQVLGLRMATHAIYKCTLENFFLATKKHHDMHDVFQFGTTMAAIRSDKPPGLCAVLLIIDEFNYVVDEQPSMSKKILKVIGNYMTTNAKSDNIVVFPVIAGTVYGELEQSFRASGFGRHLVSLPPLSKESTEKIFRACLPSHKHWLDFVPFQRLLYLMASTPRV